MSLRLRLLLGLVPLFLVGLVATSVVTYTALQSFLLTRVDQQLRSAAGPVEAVLQGNDSGFGRSFVPRSDGSPDGGPGTITIPIGTYGELRSPSGSVVTRHTWEFQSSSSAFPILPATLTPPSSGDVVVTAPGNGGVSQYRVLEHATMDGSGQTVLVGLPLDDANSTLRQLQLLELGIGGGVTVLLGVATWFIVRRGLRPLSRMADTARSIAATDLSRRVHPASATTEVGRLGLALNGMLGQLESSFAQRARSEQRLRHFVSDAGHELRTPLTSMRGYAELFRRTPAMSREDISVAMRRIEEESKRMSVLVDDLLVLARLDQGRPLEQLPVALAPLVRDACADARVADPARALTLTADQPLTVMGDSARLRQVLGNLLRNAQVHTPAGSPIEMVVHRDGDQALIDVIDHGRGIPPGAADRIFERFHRADPLRSRDQGGSGLGLSIVAAVLAAHGGRVAVSQTPGGGATFRVELPLAPSTHDHDAITTPPLPRSPVQP